jgi:hypothetical protein
VQKLDGVLERFVSLVQELPGFIPQVLRRDAVSLLRADQTVFNAAGLLAMQALRPLHLERKSATGQTAIASVFHRLAGRVAPSVWAQSGWFGV